MSIVEQHGSAGLLPWHVKAYQALLTQLDTGRLPHAMLFSGPEGIGKSHFAQVFAQRLLCQRPLNGLPCGECQGCRLGESGSHPDKYILAPDADARDIKIDAIRKMVNFSQRTAQFSGYRVIIISPADGMNRAAQNALLKTLEEPGARTVVLLVNHQPSMLLPTIRSRCQQRSLGVPLTDQALPWLVNQGIDRSAAAALLQAAAGAPLRALALQQDELFAKRVSVLEGLIAVATRRKSVVQGAAGVEQHDPQRLAESMYDWIARALRQQGTGQADADTDLQPLLSALAEAAPSSRLLRLAQRLLEGRRQLVRGGNPNKTLLYEQWMLVLAGME